MAATVTMRDQTGAGEAARGSGERVLVVEDDRATRLGLTELIGSWGFLAEGAADGEEGLAKVTSFRPSIVVSDLVMPRMGGLELLRVLQDQLGDLTVIILTAQGSVESAVEAMKGGAQPFRCGRIISMMRPALSSSSSVTRLSTAMIASRGTR